MSADLLDVALSLAEAMPGSDEHASRSISTSYYAVFRHVCVKASSLLPGGESGELVRAREHIERSIEHAVLLKRCKAIRKSDIGFPRAIIDYASAISDLQEDRHLADYSRSHRFSREDALQRYRRAREAIEGFDACDEKHQRAFVVWANFEKRY